MTIDRAHMESKLNDRIENNDGELKLDRRTFEEIALGDDLTMADVKRVEHRLASYRAASTSALGNRALDILTADPSLDEVKTIAEYGSQSRITNRVRREHTVGKGDKAKSYFGHSTVVVSNGDEPDLLDAIESIGNRGRELFGNK